MFDAHFACCARAARLFTLVLLGLGCALPAARAEYRPFELFAAPMYVVMADWGAVVGGEYPFLPWLSAGGSFGGYGQRPLRRNWLTRLELTARKTMRRGPVFEGFLSAGLRNIVLRGKLYEVGEGGEVHEQSRFTQAQFAGAVGFGFGGSFERHKLPLRIVLRAELMFSAPYFQGAALDLPISLRVSYRFGGSR
jgi:hypothetical protein